MQTLKFRGIDYDSGKVIYSDKAIIEDGKVDVLFDEHNVKHYVDIDTVKQLIFVDYNGREVYEGDIITMHPDFGKTPHLEADFSFLTNEERWRLVKEVYGNEEYFPDTKNDIDLELQAYDLHDKISRDARLGFSKSAFDLLPDLSELRDVD